MNILFSCIGKRGYIADYFREACDDNSTFIGTSSSPWTPGFHSCDKSYVVPPYRDRDAYKREMLSICRDEKVDALISFMDEDVAVLASFRDELLDLGVSPVIPPSDIANLCLDKWDAHCFFLENGFRTARTYLDISSCLKDVESGALDFPLFLKPRFGFGSGNNFKVRNRGELKILFEYQGDMLIQETLSGECYNVDLLCDKDSRLLSIIPWRKFQSRMGETEQAMTVEFPELLHITEKLVHALNGHVGPMDIDYFVKDGKVSILEMNPRFGGGYPVSHLAGGEFPKKIIEDIRGGEGPAVSLGNYERDVVMMKQLKPFGGNRDYVKKHLLQLPDVAL